MGKKGKKKSQEPASTAGSSSGQEQQPPQPQQQQPRQPQQQQPPQPQQQPRQPQQQQPPQPQQRQQQQQPLPQHTERAWGTRGSGTGTGRGEGRSDARGKARGRGEGDGRWRGEGRGERGEGRGVGRGERGVARGEGDRRKEMTQLGENVQRTNLGGQGVSTVAPELGQRGYRQEQGPGEKGAWGGRGARQEQRTEMPPHPYQAQPAQQISQVPTGPPPEKSKASTPSPRPTPPSTPAAKPMQAPPSQATVTSPRKTQQFGMSIPIPVRKNPLRAGTKGRPIEVETNMISIYFGSKFNPNAIHYDVDFKPDKPKFLLKLAYEAARQKYFPNRFPAYDGKKNLFSANDLPFGNEMSCDVTIFDPERQQERSVKVTIKKVNTIDLSWLRNVQPGSIERDQLSMQVLDVILRCGAAARSVTVGRNLFQQPKGQVVSLTGGLELWVGAFQSAVLGWKPFLNIDVAHKGFPTAQNIIELMKELAGGGGGGGGGRYRQERPREIGPEDIERAKYDIEKYLKGLKVVYEIPGLPTSRRTQRVNGLVECAQNYKFKLDDGKETTVFEYYRTSRNYTLRFPRMPCLWVGSRERSVCYPAELCTLAAGQVLTRKMDETQTSKMIREAATSTDERKRKILNAFNNMNYNNDPSVKEFGLSVGGGLEKVAARVLDPPDILYQNANRPVPVRKGVWRADKFLNPAHLPESSWTILNLNERFVRERDIYQLHDELCKVGRVYGMEIGAAKTPFCNINARNFRDIVNFFEKQKELQIRLVIVIVPDSGNTYSKVKQVAELRVGCLTQCVKSRTISRLSEATVGNILLKINSKLNGINHTFITRTKPRVLLEPCMIVGADVTHPSPDATDIPSIAAVAASHDPRVFKFSIEIRLQPPREEIILDLEEIIRIQLRIFHKKTGYIPRKIIFYRDGVSEGQFSTVMARELRAIQRACQSMQKDGGYKPPITFLVVQKRHHVRLFPTAPQNSDDWHKNKNVQAGTVVDTTITHPSHIDFYLVSHASIQGTARPTKYRCLWDDSDMSEDEIEELTYYLCHMFSRCTRSVSYPTPTYYAHLAAFRARALTQEVNINLNNLSEEQRTKLTLNEKILENPMFFV